MNVPAEVWEYFDNNYAETVRLFLDDARLTARLEEIKEELAALRRVPSLSPSQELAALRKEIAEEIAAEEAKCLSESVKSNAVLARLIENRRVDERVGNHTCTTRTAIFDKRWREHEVSVSGVAVFDSLRKLFDAACDYQEERIKAGEVEDVHIPAAKKTVQVTKLEKEAHSIRLELNGDRLSPSWRYSNGGHPTQDFLKLMMVEYHGAMRNVRYSFAVRPEHRRATSNSWGKIQSADHPDAASISLTDEEDIKAFHALTKFFLGEE